MIKESRFVFSLLLITAFSFLIQDLVLQNYFGTIARCPILFIGPSFFILLVVHQKKIYFDPVIKYYLFYVLATVVSAIFLLLFTVLFVTHGGLYAYEEFMPVKLIRASFYNISYFFAAYVLFTLAKGVSINSIYRILNIMLYFLFIYGLLQLAFRFKIPLLNSSDTGEATRISLTAPEPSIGAPMFTTIASTVIALRIYLNKNILITFVLIILSLIILVFIGSKGALLILPLAIIIAIRKQINFKIFIMALLVIVPMAIVLLKIVLPSIAKDINSFDSFSTRVTTWIAAFESLFRYPFGEGYGTYLIYYPSMLLPVNNQIIRITGLPLLNDELIDMIQTGKNVAAKAGIANEIVSNGFFTIILVYYLSKYYNGLKKALSSYSVNIIFSMLGVFLLMSFLFTTALESAYYYLIPFMVLQKLASANTATSPS